MKTTFLQIPTYDPDCDFNYDDTRLHILTLLENGALRVVLGRPEDRKAPDVFIERAFDLWRVIIHPNDGDPLCIIELQENRAVVADDFGNILLDERLA